jgi:hypothetical protein
MQLSGIVGLLVLDLGGRLSCADLFAMEGKPVPHSVERLAQK